jgi:LMBR1 domain-containing protein 1
MAVWVADAASHSTLPPPPSRRPVQVTFIIYTAALMSFVGWFIFSIYVGIGFVALPLDCFNAFRYRPRPLGYSELEKTRKNMRDRCQELLKVANEILGDETKFADGAHTRSERRKRAKMTGQELNRYRVLVDMLELDLEKYQMSDPKYYRDHYNPLVPYAKLLFGIISVVISAVWFIHIIIYMLFNPPVRAPGGAGVVEVGVSAACIRGTPLPPFRHAALRSCTPS